MTGIWYRICEFILKQSSIHYFRSIAGIDRDACRTSEERLMLADVQSWLRNKAVLDEPHVKTGATALHVAASKGYIKVMR